MAKQKLVPTTKVVVNQEPARFTNEQAIDINFVGETLRQFQSIGNNAADDYNNSKERLNDLIKNRREIGRGAGMLIASEAENTQAALNTRIKALEKTFTIQKFMSESAMKQMSVGQGNENNDVISVARAIVSEMAAQNPNMKQIRNVSQSIDGAKSNPVPQNELDKRIQELEAGNEISFNENELAIRYEDQPVEYMVNKTPQGLRFVAVLNNQIIPDFPASRMPSITNITIEGNVAVDTKTRTQYKLI